LFSFLRKNKQDPASGDREFVTRAEEESKAVRSRGRRKSTAETSRGDDPVDPVLPEKKRARRRLVGAVALVLAAIIGLPMLMDSAPKPLADDIAIQIPSKDKPFRPAPAPRDKPAASAALEKTPSAEPSAVTTPAVPATAATTATTAPKAALKADAKPETKIEAKPDAKIAKAAPPAVVMPEKKDDAARARAILDGKSEAPAVSPAATPATAQTAAKAVTTDKPGKFVIQVAALGSQQKVNELQGKLKGAGIKSYTQKVATQSGERIRIRVGPFNSKEEADKVRARIVKLGLNGTLVPA
jgi:DedD protein